MAYPRLLLTGNAATGVLEEISLDDPDNKIVYDGLTRLKHTVTRQVQTKANSQNTGLKYSAVPFDRVRLIETFIGYVDVLTASVCDTIGGNGVADATTLELIKKAVFYNNSNGITFDYALPTFTGSGDPSGTSDSRYGKNANVIWNYKAASSEPGTTVVWLIKNIDVTDNGNNTSRVTFVFEAVGPWQDTAELIDALGDE